MANSLKCKALLTLPVLVVLLLLWALTLLLAMALCAVGVAASADEAGPLPMGVLDKDDEGRGVVEALPTSCLLLLLPLGWSMSAVKVSIESEPGKWADDWQTAKQQS